MFASFPKLGDSDISIIQQQEDNAMNTAQDDRVWDVAIIGGGAAGNVVNPGMQVSEAAANGARVAMTINTELVFARADQAVADANAEEHA